MSQLYRKDTQSVALKVKEELKVIDDKLFSFMDNPKTVQMGKYIEQGLPDHEAGILAGYSEEKMVDLRKNSIEYQKYVKLKQIKFKQKHLATISDKNDAKTSQWMLEKTFPEDYGRSITADPSGSSDGTVLAAIIRSIQRNDAEPVKATYEVVSDSKEKSGHNETKRLEEDNKSLDAGGKNIL